MSANHTPGPWKAVKETAHGAFSQAWQVRADDGTVICRLPTGLSAELAANASIIAALPDMEKELSARCVENDRLRAQVAELAAALRDLISPRYPVALRDGEHWAMQAETVARAAIAKVAP